MAHEGMKVGGMKSMGVDAEGRLLWGGEVVITEKRWGVVERRIAIAGLIIGGIGVAATVVQAWAAFLPSPSRSDFQSCLELMREDAQADAIYLLSMCKDI